MNWINDTLAALKTKTGVAGLLYALQAPLMSLFQNKDAISLNGLTSALNLRDLITGAAIVWARSAIQKLAAKK